jgi:hypothetical protein
MEKDNKPFCAADALRRIRQIPINGIPTGICMLDECLAEVKAQDLKTDPEVRAALLKRVNVTITSPVQSRTNMPGYS